MSEIYNRTRRNVAAAAAFLLAMTASGCAKDEPINYNSPALVLAGSAPWGNVEILKENDSCVQGTLAWGDVNLCQRGDKIEGKSPWGDVHVTIHGDHIVGSLPWGDMDASITESGITGSLPWGDVKLQASGQHISGSLPWGEAHFRLGEHYHAITNPLAEIALVAIMSDKT